MRGLRPIADIQPGSATFGRPFQVSYGMNYVTGGPNGRRLGELTNGNGTSNVLLAWDHSNLPICATTQSGALAVPWPFNAPDTARHYAPRHLGLFLRLVGLHVRVRGGDLVPALCRTRPGGFAALGAACSVLPRSGVSRLLLPPDNQRTLQRLTTKRLRLDLWNAIGAAGRSHARRVRTAGPIPVNKINLGGRETL